jgi:hypothetical protein
MEHLPNTFHWKWSHIKTAVNVSELSAVFKNHSIAYIFPVTGPASEFHFLQICIINIYKVLNN